METKSTRAVDPGEFHIVLVVTETKCGYAVENRVTGMRTGTYARSRCERIMRGLLKKNGNP